jgi:outer membrane protein assembly factor BamB
MHKLKFCASSALLLAMACLVACAKSPEAGSKLRYGGPESLPAVPATGQHYAQTAWASVHRDSSNSDYVPLNPTSNVKLQWTALEGAALLVGPVIGPEGKLYVPSGRGRGTSHLHAYSSDGVLLWESPVMRDMADFDYAAVVCAPIVDPAGNVYAADSNQLWSFTAYGEIRWVADLNEHGIEGFFVTPLFSKEGYVGGVSTDGKVALFHRENGGLALPVLDLPGVAGPPSQPIPPGLWHGMLAEPFRAPLWDLIYGREIEVANTPAVHPETGRIFITAGGDSTEAGVLYGIDTGIESASIAFTAPMGAGSGTSPAISPDGRYVYAIDDSGVMFGFATDSGKRVWEVADTMGQASPSVGPDGTIYSFNGLAGTIVAVDGTTGAVKWSRQYDDIAHQHLRWIPGLSRLATVDSLITVTDNGLWAFLDLNYEIGSDEQSFPQPRKIVVTHLDVNNGDVLGWFESPDSSGAFMVPNADGMIYLTLSGTATSISYFGINDQLPFFLRSPLRPQGGLVAFKPAGSPH